MVCLQNMATHYHCDVESELLKKYRPSLVYRPQNRVVYLVVSFLFLYPIVIVVFLFSATFTTVHLQYGKLAESSLVVERRDG